MGLWLSRESFREQLILTRSVSRTVFQLPRSGGRIIAFDNGMSLVNSLVLVVISANIAISHKN